VSSQPQLRDRPASRILLVDRSDRILLFRFDPPDRPPFWVTPGGELAPGESYEAGARRELREETGIDCDCGIEVAQRVVEFVTLDGTPVLADERYFLVRTAAAEITTDGHTPEELQVMRHWRWFTAQEIEDHDEPIFPVDLVEILSGLSDRG
jgi:8-oxo-dGTP pyrophosphatase MutT (NUDIX family)